MSKLSLRAALIAAAGILITIGGCGEVPSAVTPAPDGLQLLKAPAGPVFSATGSGSFTASAVIGAEGGTLVGPGGARITFPAGSLSEPTRITMSPSAGFLGVELQPHGLVFPADRQPVLSLPLSGVMVGLQSRLWIVYVDGGSIQEVLPTSTVSGGTLSATLPHFSGYIGAQG